MRLRGLLILITLFTLPAIAQVKHDQRFDLFSVFNFPAAAKMTAKPAVNQRWVPSTVNTVIRDDYERRVGSYSQSYSPAPYTPAQSTRAPSNAWASSVSPLFAMPAASNGGVSYTETPSVQAASGSCQRIGIDRRLLDEVKNHPTPGQLRCRQNAPARPQKVVYGFSGLLGDWWMSGIIQGMAGGAPVHFEYYPHHQVSDQYLMDSARCAYEMATKAYRVGGRTVYNPISIVGHSFGGDAAHRLAVMLGKLGVAVDMVVTADARQPWTLANKPNWGRSCNVARWDNYYETAGGMNLPGFAIPGATNIHVGGDHMSIPSNGILRNNTRTALMNMPDSRPSYTASVYSVDRNIAQTLVGTAR